MAFSANRLDNAKISRDWIQVKPDRHYDRPNSILDLTCGTTFPTA